MAQFTRLRQLFTYSGSKFLLAAVFATYYAPHRRFVSLFGGSAGEFAGKAPSAVEVYNDLDDHLHTVWRVLQNPKQYEQLQRLIENTPNGRRQFEACCQILQDSPRSHSPVRRAWAFLVVGNTCRGGLHPAITKSWGNTCDTADKQVRNLLTLPIRLEEWRERFRRVRIEHADWHRLFTTYDRQDTQFFLDPPYFPGTLRSSTRLYRHELAIQMHVKLLRVVCRAKGYVMLCGYNHPLYTAYLFHWRKVEFPARAHMGTRGASRREVIWLNYEADGSRISSNKLLIAKRYVQMLGGAACAQRYLDRMVALLELPSPNGTTTDGGSSRGQTWLAYADDGRRLPSTKMLIARRYIEAVGGISAAQRYLDRIVALLDFPNS